jgi:pimeloyl-ACP methyl ester carboxylesterase
MAGVTSPPQAADARCRRYDPSFIARGAEAYKQGLPDAEIHLLDAGHFALDEKTDEIASRMIDFLRRRGPGATSQENKD